MHGRVLLEEIFVVHAFWIALHGQRTSGKMRHQHGRYADAIVDHLALSEAGAGIENLVEIRKLQLAAVHFDDGRSGHRAPFSLVVGRWSLAERLQF